MMTTQTTRSEDLAVLGVGAPAVQREQLGVQKVQEVRKVPKVPKAPNPKSLERNLGKRKRRSSSGQFTVKEAGYTCGLLSISTKGDNFCD